MAAMTTPYAGTEYTAGGGGPIPTTTGTTYDKGQATYSHPHPHDQWSARDLLLSFMPLIIALAFKDASLRGGILVALIISVYLFFKRTAMWGSWRKHTWPTIDLTNVVLFAVLLGVCWKYRYWIQRWLPTIIGSVYAVVALLTLLWRRPFTGHYARYDHHDEGGHNLFDSDTRWRLTNDISTASWFAIFAIICLLSLPPNITGHWRGFHALNIIFNYIVPFVLIAGGLLLTELLGIRFHSNHAHGTHGSHTTTATGPVTGGTTGAPYAEPATTTIYTCGTNVAPATTTAVV